MKLILCALMLPLLFISLFAQGQSLIVYDVKDHRSQEGERIAFISLSDGYRLVDHPDSQAVPNEHLGERGKVGPGYFTLTDQFRSRCLRKTKIAESDKVYIYDYVQNIHVVRNIADLKLVALVSPYYSSQPLSQHDYMIGFEMDGESLKGFHEHFLNAYAVVGKEDPFIREKMYPMVWEKVDSVLFPPHNNKDHSGLTMKVYPIGQTYRYERDNLTYFLQDYMWKNRLSYRRFIVTRFNDHSVVYSNLYYDGESSSFAPLHLANDDKVTRTLQWTGRLFKNKPTVFVGLTFHSFGCPAIDFIDLKEPSIRIYCDNRH